MCYELNDLLNVFQGIGICGQNPAYSTRLEYGEDLGKVKTCAHCVGKYMQLNPELYAAQLVMTFFIV